MSDVFTLTFSYSFGLPEVKNSKVEVPVKLGQLSWNMLSEEQKKKVITMAYISAIERGIKANYLTGQFRIDRVTFTIRI